jgi:hypothetical protein
LQISERQGDNKRGQQLLNIENSLNHDIQLAESMLLADDNNLDAMVSCELHYEDKNS